jgi:formate/nitrite transporter FocA (FNT family)
MIDAGEKKLASPCDLLIRDVISGALLGAATTLALTGVVTTEVGALILPASPGYFAFGFEHAVVNMFVIPRGIMLGAKVNVYDWWVWNQFLVTLGGFVFTALYVTYEPAKQSITAAPVAAQTAAE